MPVLFATVAALTVSDVHAQNTWEGTTDAIWDIADGKMNWSNTVYTDGEDVIFDDAGIAQNMVSLAAGATLAPNSISFGNTSGSYTIDDFVANTETLAAAAGIMISGANTDDVNLNVKITGNTSITHSGTGTLLLGAGAVDNDFVGTISVDGGGILKNGRGGIDNINSLGNFANTFSFSNGSTFDLNSIGNHRDYQEYNTGSFVFEDGTTLTNTGSVSNDAFDDELNFAGNVTISGTGRIDILGDLSVTGTNIVITAENTSGAVLGSSNAGKSIAEWVVNDGIVFASADTSFGDATVTVNTGGAISGNVGQGGTHQYCQCDHLEWWSSPCQSAEHYHGLQWDRHGCCR